MSEEYVVATVTVDPDRGKYVRVKLHTCTEHRVCLHGGLVYEIHPDDVGTLCAGQMAKTFFPTLQHCLVCAHQIHLEQIQ